MRRFVRSALRRLAGEPSGPVPAPEYLSDEFRSLFAKYQTETMLNWRGMLSAYEAVRHVQRNDVPGVIIECGVYRGGCSAMMAEIAPERDIYLFDTFEGMPPPSDLDRRLRGTKASAISEYRDGWCYSSLEHVMTVMSMSGRAQTGVHYVKGKVEETLPAFGAAPIAILRLDTDWYSSTKAEFDYLYQHVSKHGVVLVDDYGAWSGARQATDEAVSGKDVFLMQNGTGALTIVKLS